MMSARATYTKDQITKYFDRLGLPEQERKYDVAGLDPDDALEYLARLQTLQLATVPFENMNLHYSVHHSISVHPEALFRKVIGDDNGRGGYCMENNTLFGTLLNSLGFSLYSGAGKVWEGDSWTGWSHMINFVTIGDTKYHVDVGFGADGPVVPMPLHRSGTVQKHIRPASARLQWRNIPGNVDPNQRVWVYEYRRSDDSDWQVKYSYSELEFQPQDFTMINDYTCTTTRTFFTLMVVADKKIMGDDGELVGKLSLAAKSLKWNIAGQKIKQIEFKNEEERIEALDKYFGIKFGDAEREAIVGLPSEIK